MTSAATLLLLAAALGAPEPVDLAPPPELDAAPAALQAVAPEPGADAEVPLPPVAVDPGAEPGPATTGGPGDPLYERLFGGTEATLGAEQHRTLPTMPAWLWLASGGGLVGLYLWRQRKKGEEAGPGQIEILGHTRVGPKARLTVVRVAGADGVPRRLLLSTGEGAPALVADLGTEGAPAAPAPTFAQALDGALSTSLAQAPAAITAVTDEAPIGPPADDDAGVIPPPRVPVWNETPDEYRAARREPTPPPAVAEPPAQDPLAGLTSALGEDEAPELALDVSWDAERGWQGLERVTAHTAPGSPPAEAQEEMIEEPDVVEEAGRPTPPADSWPSEAARAAFQALLGGAPQESPKPPARREPFVRPVARVVKPMRPWQVAPARRTPYDPVVEQEPTAPGQLLARSSAEVQDLVAEVLRERTDAPRPSGDSDRVVDLAGYVRRQVQR